jgi:hypothetical protein
MGWAKSLEGKDRHVDQTKLPGGIRVSTVFLGIDHNFFDEGPPLLFETMIFGIDDDSYQTRCSTYDQAVKMHEKALKHVEKRKKREGS